MKTNDKKPVQKVKANDNGKPGKKVRKVPDSTLRGKPNTRKRPVQRPRPANTEEKRVALMRAAQETVEEVQKFKKDLHQLGQNYKLVMVSKPCTNKLKEFFGIPVTIAVVKDGEVEELTSKPHNHVHIYKIADELKSKLRSRYTEEVHFAVVKDKVLKKPGEEVTYYPIEVTTFKVGFIKAIYRTFFGKTLGVEEARDAIEEGVEEFIKAEAKLKTRVLPVM